MPEEHLAGNHNVLQQARHRHGHLMAKRRGIWTGGARAGHTHGHLGRRRGGRWACTRHEGMACP